jgi:predicted type IV restriction endonuclease
MFDSKNSNSNVSGKENNKKYRVKRKLNERDNINILENDDVNILKIKTKFKTDKHSYIDNIDYFCIKNNNSNRLSDTNYSICTEATQETAPYDNSVINMELEKSLVEKHCSSQNDFLNKLMFMNK